MSPSSEQLFPFFFPPFSFLTHTLSPSIRNTAKEVNYVLTHSRASIILVDSEFAHLVQDPPAGTTVILSRDTGGRVSSLSSLPDPYEEYLQSGRDLWTATQKAELEAVRKIGWRDDAARRDWELIELDADENAPCALCYTSGTTGKPK